MHNMGPNILARNMNFPSVGAPFYTGRAGGDSGNFLGEIPLTGLETPPFIPMDNRTAKQLRRSQGASQRADTQAVSNDPNAPAQASRPGTAVSVQNPLMAYLPWILGLLVVGGVVYFVLRKRSQ